MTMEMATRIHPMASVERGVVAGDELGLEEPVGRQQQPEREGGERQQVGAQPRTTVLEVVDERKGESREHQREGEEVEPDHPLIHGATMGEWRASVKANLQARTRAEAAAGPPQPSDLVAPPPIG